MPWLLLGACCVCFVACDGAQRRAPKPRPQTPAARSAPTRPPAREAAAATASGDATTTAAAPGTGSTAPPRYVLLGGGAFPESTEASLEADMRLAARVFSGPGTLLFAGGSASRSVRTLDPALRKPGLSARLGAIFAPRVGRASRYRAPALRARSATRAAFDAALTAALTAALSHGEPLLLYVAAHGEQGERPADNRVLLWGGDTLHVDELAALHERNPAPLRMVVASCYSGGFAELAFAGADADRGITEAPRCGLFAGTWDRQTAGCDPDPDRRRHEGYSLHFLHALRGEGRDGAPLEGLDLDGDGGVSLLEAHTRARAASASIDVPTTTSERYLRAVQRSGGPPATALLPEDAFVVEALGRRLGLDTASAADERLSALGARLDALDRDALAAETALDDAYRALAAVLLARYPVLDDAYHPDFAPTLASHGDAIAALLRDAPEARAYGAAQAALDAADGAYWAVRAREAQVLRYVRAQETLALAGALASRGGEDFERYRRLLACERHLPSQL